MRAKPLVRCKLQCYIIIAMTPIYSSELSLTLRGVFSKQLVQPMAWGSMNCGAGDNCDLRHASATAASITEDIKARPVCFQNDLVVFS